MIWSNFVAGSALSAIAAAAVTRSARPRMSATMISLPAPFILAKGAVCPITAAIWRKRPEITSATTPSVSDEAAARPSEQQQHRNHANNEDRRQYLGEIAGSPRHAAEAERSGDERDDDENDDPFEHGVLRH